jgi:uncharacterized coiled-coil protein SlyX
MDRTQELEIKIAYVEHHVAELDAIVRGLSDEIVRLRKEMAEIREGVPSAEGSTGHEKPPHY